MDQRTHNPYEVERHGNRVRLISLIDGTAVEADARSKLAVRSAERLITQHNQKLIGLQTAAGLNPQATYQQRQQLWEQWHYIHAEYSPALAE